MYSKTIDVVFEIGRYMSEHGEIFENFVEYRVEAINILKHKLKNITIPSQIKENLLVTLFTLQKSQNLFEYYRWQKSKLDSNLPNFSSKNLHENFDTHMNNIESQIIETLESSNISINQIKNSYKSIISCLDSIAIRIKSEGSSSIDENFILDVFNVKNKQNYIKN